MLYQRIYIEAEFIASLVVLLSDLHRSMYGRIAMQDLQLERYENIGNFS